MLILFPDISASVISIFETIQNYFRVWKSEICKIKRPIQCRFDLSIQEFVSLSDFSRLLRRKFWIISYSAFVAISKCGDDFPRFIDLN